MLSGLRILPSQFDGATPRERAYQIVISLVLVAVLTGALAALQRFVDVGTVTVIYVIAVLFAAIRGGIVSAVITALAAVAATAFFFYPPIYDFRVYDPVHILDLVLFIVVAVVTGKLATDARRARTREQADGLREALIGSVSHELRTPLSSIVGAASVLAQSPEVAKDDRLRPLVQGLRDEADRLNDHIQNLLDATRISSEGIRPRTEWVDPGDIVTAAIERKRGLFGGHNLIIGIADNLPLIQVDPTLIERALEQLIENAVKYSAPNSKIDIVAEQIGRELRIAVRDNGEGFDPEERERLWDRFYRSPRLRDKIEGSGLGLWVARSLVIACGGRVEAFSAGIGRGATLSLYLPVQPHSGPERVEEADE